MDNIVINNSEYRIKKMNAIEFLALRSQLDFSTMQSTMNCYSTILEQLEIKVKDQWLPVKKGDIYLPAELETNFQLMEELITFFLNYLKEVFPKSNA